MGGLILIVLARAIAMVIVWNDLANCDADYLRGSVAFNSISRSCFRFGLRFVFITACRDCSVWCANSCASQSAGQIAESLDPTWASHSRGPRNLESSDERVRQDVVLRHRSYVRRSARDATFLSSTIVVMFSIKGSAIRLAMPRDVVRIAVPAAATSFASWSLVSFLFSRRVGGDLPACATLSSFPGGL